jgi:PAS domain S-box-containing protein
VKPSHYSGLNRISYHMGVAAHIPRVHFYEESFRLFVESVPDAMVLSRPDGRIVLVNARAEKLFGYRRDELPGKKVDILIPPPRHKSRLGIAREALGIRKDRSRFRVEVSISQLEVNGETLVWNAIREVSGRAFASRIRAALGELATQTGLISICSWCKRVRDERRSWQPLDQYIESHSEARFTHGVCSDCLHNLDPRTGEWKRPSRVSPEDE